jgi:hypothetical protein
MQRIAAKVELKLLAVRVQIKVVRQVPLETVAVLDFMPVVVVVVIMVVVPDMLVAAAAVVLASRIIKQPVLRILKDLNQEMDL